MREYGRPLLLVFNTQKGPDTALDLVESQATANGVTIQVYRPTGRPQYATGTDAAASTGTGTARPTDADGTDTGAAVGESRSVISKRMRRNAASDTRRRDGGPLLFIGLTLASVYGGYFSAAQGIIYMSLMGILLDETMQRLVAVKNVLAGVVNTVTALFFLFVADFDWTAVVLIAAGSGGTWPERSAPDS